MSTFETIITPEDIAEFQQNQIPNRGTGAGGANTNKNGLPYEQLTDLNTEYQVISSDLHHKRIQFNKNTDKTFTTTQQSHVFKHMDQYVNKNIPKAHGCKNPDECFIDENSKTMFIIEKKFQQVTGSVCEKIQSPDFKIWQYQRTFADYNIVYIYCLSEWFKDNCKAEIEYLQYKKIPIFWGNSPTYKEDMVHFLLSYTQSPP